MNVNHPQQAIKSVPEEVLKVKETLQGGGFTAYLVGGCVRDLLSGHKPKDWDITTNARPETIVGLFAKSFYENEFGTVGVVNEGVADKSLEVIEVTTYRVEKGYSDRRHPDTVSFSDDILDDLKRRDFTINAIALSFFDKGQNIEIIDPYKGQKDIKDKIIKSVGDPNERFAEDALRLLRAIRLSCELGFAIETKTMSAVIKNAFLLENIAKERIRDEFVRILMSSRPQFGLELLKDSGLLQYIVPELIKTVGVEQNKAHAYDVWVHLLKTLEHSAKKSFPLKIRLAALLHDVSKPESRGFSKKKGVYTFYGHDVVGSRVTRRILERLKFPKEVVQEVSRLVRWHMFFSDTEKITLSAVRRLIRNVGQENVWDLIKLRMCDRIGTGRPKESPYRLRKYKAMIEEVARDPVSVSMLKIKGERIMEVTRETPGPKIGLILHALLEEVIENPSLNTSEYLEKKAKDLAILPFKQLEKLGKKGKETKNKEDEKAIRCIRKRHWVE